jgi:hypothetical protein
MALRNAHDVTVPVELFGTPRLRAGRPVVEVILPQGASRRQVVGALAKACPELVGHAILDDLSGLQDGFVFNRGGTAFLSGEQFSIQQGDSLLLLSNQAGG